jgi:hypothetical protein
MGLPSLSSLPAVDQSQLILVAMPPRANSGMWQVWQAILSVWSLSLVLLAGCGRVPWQAWQVDGFTSFLPRMWAPAFSSVAVGA